MKVVLLSLTAVISYSLGGINGSIISSLSFFHRDVRNYGSGNAGLTNYLRTFGVSSLWVAAVIDILKSVISVLIGGWLMRFVDAQMVGQLFAGFCLIMGHTYPIYYNFRGGKGVLCAGVLALMVDWRVGLVCWAVFLIVVIFTRYVSLGSITAILCLPVFMWIFNCDALEGELALMIALLVVVKHAENILRLIGGTEPKLTLKSGSSRKNRNRR